LDYNFNNVIGPTFCWNSINKQKT